MGNSLPVTLISWKDTSVILAGPTPSTLTESLSIDLDNFVRTTCGVIKYALNNFVLYEKSIFGFS